MMKILFIVFSMIIFSCEDISETIDNYTYEQYMEDGWEAFVYKEWGLGKLAFNIGLLQDSENYSEAYSGLGWTYLFEANSIPGQENASYRSVLRDSSSMYFNLAYVEGMDNTLSWSDVLVGMAYLYNFKTDSLLFEYYNNIYTDNSLLDLMIDYSNDAINITNELLLLNSNYNFYPYIPLDDEPEYDLCINKNNIRILRAQLFFNIEDYSNVLFELSQLSDDYVCPNGTPENMQEAIYCMSTISNKLYQCEVE